MSQKHWLVQSETIRLLWKVLFALLALLLFADLFIHQHEVFGIEGSFGFFAWYGFFTCVAMVLVAKLLGVLLKRTDTYYED